jgi:tRNA pseudouridine38-40 synthase
MHSGNLFINPFSLELKTLTASVQSANESPAPNQSTLAEPLQAFDSQNWKLTLAYDGTDFSGWQVQPGEQTIQGELQAALARVTNESPLPQGAGRTDAGVHALGQVASFKLQARIPAENLHRALNRTLPRAIRILDARTVGNSFHARHSAVAKTYEYRVFRGQVCPPFQARYVYPCPWPMDLELLQQAARWFEGEHDFLSFAATDPDLRSRERVSGTGFDLEAQTRNEELARSIGKQGAVRTIYSSAWDSRDGQGGQLLVYRVRGNGFLHHMVRNLVGTMLDVGRGYRKVEAIGGMLAARSRAASGPTAPAEGLLLDSVEYEAQNGW